MKKLTILLVAALALLGLGRPAGADTLPVTTGLIYQLDASDPANIHFDGSGNITSWSSSQGANPITMVPVTGNSSITAPTYLANGGGTAGRPAVKFVATTTPTLTCQKLVSEGINAVPRSVFIVENSDSPPGTGLGGIWGRTGTDQGVRFWSDNAAPALWGEPSQPANTHQLVNAVIRSGDNRYVDFGINTNGDNGQPMWTDNYRWTDMTLFDSRQTWTNMNWGVIQADRYATNLGGASNWTQGTALGNYYEGPNRSWSGQISEVLVYDAWLSDVDRQAVETYLKNKWLGNPWPGYLPGDFNKDGQVGPEDFGILKDQFGVSALPHGNHDSWTLGDANDDGQIGPEDFGLLKDNFGASNGPTGTYPLANVPEPTALALLALGGLLAARRNRR